MKGIVAGFGKSEDSDIQNVQRVTKVPIISYNDCIKSSDHEYIMSHRTFCGGYANGTGVCIGDSGSGLVVSFNGQFFLRGIVSASLYGTKYGCNLNTRSVFTDVVKFSSWINSGGVNECEDSIFKLQVENEKNLKELNKEKEKNMELQEQIRMLKEQLKAKIDQLKKAHTKNNQATDVEITSNSEPQMTNKIQIQNKTERLRVEVNLQKNQEHTKLSLENEKLNAKLNSTKEQLKKVRHECQDEKQHFEIDQQECNTSLQYISIELNQTRDDLDALSQQCSQESKQLIATAAENESLKEETEQHLKKLTKMESEKNELELQLLFVNQNLLAIQRNYQNASKKFEDKKQELLQALQNNDNLSIQLATNQEELKKCQDQNQQCRKNSICMHTEPG